jgi:DNA-binding MarR family transcriptional regulator
MTEKQLRVYRYLKVYGSSYPRDIAKRLGYSESAWVAQELKALFRKSLINSIGKAKLKKYFIIHQNN